MSVHLGSDLIVSALEKAGAKFAFGIPGGTLAGIFHSLSASKQIQVVLAQHESTAAYMAMGNYLFGDRDAIPVVFTTSGPGATNAITGVAAALEERVPMVVITANVPTGMRGKRAMQDSFDSGIDVIKIFDPICVTSTLLHSLIGVEDTILTLFHQARKHSCPVHLNIPGDVSMKVLPPPLKAAPFTLPSLEIEPRNIE